MRARLVAFAACAVLACASLSACTSTKSAGTAVSATLRDGSIELSPSTVGHGTVTVTATNEGTMTHEIEVFGPNVDPSSIVVEKGVANTEGLPLVDEVENITPGSTVALTADLDAGTYVVMCNLPGHYALGMHTVLTAT